MSTITIDTLLIERPTVYAGTDDNYNVAELIISNLYTPAGGGAGQSVTVSVDASEKNFPENNNYCIEATASQPCAVSYSNKTSSSFDITLTPMDGETLSAGTVDVKVTWARG